MSDIFVSVIIPLHNAEKFIGECLDSLLNQTFQDFEVIVADDCSADNSVAIVESYIPKFNGRLILAKTEKDSGSEALPRNKGLSISRGEYIFNMNAADKLTNTAFEELHTLAKNYDADVVYCEKFYKANPDGTTVSADITQEETLTDKPTFETEDLKERVQNIINDKYRTASWNKLVRRNLITVNEIFFPAQENDDEGIWTYGLIFCAKKFLRVPNAVYIRRLPADSTPTTEMTPQEIINSRLTPALLGLKTLDKLMSKREFFKTNPDCRFTLLKKFINERLNLSLESARKLSDDDIYSTIKNNFGEKFGEYDVLIPALCAAIYNKKTSAPLTPKYDEKNPRESDADILDKFGKYFTARVDVQLITANKEDFQTLSVSDDKAEIWKPEWINRNGVGYAIQSYAGKLDIVFKVNKSGFILLTLRGLFCTAPDNKSKRIPYWVDYTKLTVNKKVIFNNLTPAWHDKPYTHKVETKADEEITVSVEWLPHRSNT